MIVLDYQDRRPIYEQVTDKFQILILNGVLPPGSQMAVSKAACHRTDRQSQHDPACIYGAGETGTDLSCKRQRKFRSRQLSGTEDKQRELPKRIHSTDTERQKHRIQQRGTGENACGNL